MKNLIWIITIYGFFSEYRLRAYYWSDVWSYRCSGFFSVFGMVLVLVFWKMRQGNIFLLLLLLGFFRNKTFDVDQQMENNYSVAEGGPGSHGAGVSIQRVEFTTSAWVLFL
jgi:hypothetical protein